MKFKKFSNSNGKKKLPHEKCFVCHELTCVRGKVLFIFWRFLIRSHKVFLIYQGNYIVISFSIARCHFFHYNKTGTIAIIIWRRNVIKTNKKNFHVSYQTIPQYLFSVFFDNFERFCYRQYGFSYHPSIVESIAR